MRCESVASSRILSEQLGCDDLACDVEHALDLVQIEVKGIAVAILIELDDSNILVPEDIADKVVLTPQLDDGLVEVVVVLLDDAKGKHSGPWLLDSDPVSERNVIPDIGCGGRGGRIEPRCPSVDVTVHHNVEIGRHTLHEHTVCSGDSEK